MPDSFLQKGYGTVHQLLYGWMGNDGYASIDILASKGPDYSMTIGSFRVMAKAGVKCSGFFVQL